MKPLLLTAALAALIATPSLAQVRTAGGDDPAPGAQGPYVGAPKEAFYDVESRLTAAESRLRAMGGAAARAIRDIRAFAERQRARHGGELRDWDREHITARLNQLEQRYG